MSASSAGLRTSTTLMCGEMLEIPQRLEEQFARNAGLAPEVAAVLRQFNPAQQFLAGRGTSSRARLFLHYVMGTQADWLIGDLSLSIFMVYGRHTHLDGVEALSVDRWLNPDQPRHLHKVTTTF